MVKQEEMSKRVGKVKGFCYMGDRLNATSGSEPAVRAKTRIECLKFRESGEVLHKSKFSLNIKRSVEAKNFVLYKEKSR